MAKHLLFEQLLDCGVDDDTAAMLLPEVNHWLTTLPAALCWQQIVQKLTSSPETPFPLALHQLLYEASFSDWDTRQGPPPVWIPSDAQIRATNLFAVMQQLQLASYPEFHAWAAQHRAEFWQRMIQRLGICFRKQYSEIINLSKGVESPEWLVDAQLNIVESCFQAPENATAIVFQSETGLLSRITYGELHALTNRVANGLVEIGFHVGDAAAIIMPMTVEAVAIYLGIIKAGGIVVSIADSFAANEIETRLQITKAKLVFTQNLVVRAGKQLPLYAKLIEANSPQTIVLCQAEPSSPLRPEDLYWSTFLSSNNQFDAVLTHAAAYTNILFSSGTTGIPKAIPWTQTTPIKCAVDAYLHHDIQPGDILAWYTNLGWMMGPWLIYASLINRATIALYYDTPTERGYGEFIQAAGVTMLGVVPSLVNTWKTTRCMQGLNWSKIKAFSSTGEASNPQDMFFLMSLAGYRPIIEYCGGTEIGGSYVTGTLVQPCSPSTFTTPALGLDLVILDENGKPDNKGEAFIIPPSIGLSTQILNNNHHQVYFANTPSISNLSKQPLEKDQQSSLNSIVLRRHGDHLERLPNGYYRAHGRVDDTMNLRGIKISAAEIERVLNTVETVAETAAIAIAPSIGGPSLLVIYLVATPNAQTDQETLKANLQAAIAQFLNPLFKIHDLVIVEALPRTASQKVMRRILRDQYLADTKKADIPA